MRYEDLAQQALATRVQGWDWQAFRGRFVHDQPTWDFPALVRARARSVTAMLDLGTGGGEFLSELAPLPHRTTAAEAYPPNVPVARDRLAPLGVEVVDTSRYEEDELPFADGSFGLVVSRHESYRADEVGRVLHPGGCSSLSRSAAGILNSSMPRWVHRRFRVRTGVSPGPGPTWSGWGSQAAGR